MQMLKGDCLDLMKTLKDNSVDFILCDLPYAITAAKWDKLIPFDEMWSEYKRILKVGGTVALFSSQPFTTKLISSNLDNYKYTWYWIKNNATGHAFAKKQPMRQIEEISIFRFDSKGGDKGFTYNPQGLKDMDTPKQRIKISARNPDYNLYSSELNNKVYTQTKTGYPKNILYFSNNEKEYHPSQKPIDLLEYLINTYSNKGETVLDNCMGSGSTGVACVRTGRDFIGMEADNGYFKVAKRRIEKEKEK